MTEPALKYYLSIMDPYQRLLLETKLYNSEMIENFLSDTPNWNILKYREKEIRALHLTCCVYLCNLEKITDINMIMKMRQKKINLAIQRPVGPKRLKANTPPGDDVGGPSTSSTSTAPTTSSSHSDTSIYSNEEERADLMDLDIEGSSGQQFRFSLLSYMPNPAVLQSKLCEEWNIPNSTRRWDIADYKEKKFIRLEVSEDLKLSEKNYMKRAVDMRENSAMVVVGPISLRVDYLGLDVKPIGESKVRTFLTERRANMKILGLMETELSFSSNLGSSILCSPYINEWCTEWLKDCCSGEDDIIRDETLYKGKKALATNISPNNMKPSLNTSREGQGRMHKMARENPSRGIRLKHIHRGGERLRYGDPGGRED